MDMADRGKRPWHLWAVGLVGVAWNSIGAFDYSMSHIVGDSYLRQVGMTEPQIAYMAAMPAWATAVWATGVWGAIAGSILLLLRSRLAVPAFALSLAGFVLSLVYTYLMSNGGAVMGGASTLAMNALIFSGCVFFLVYASAMAKRGVLG